MRELTKKYLINKGLTKFTITYLESREKSVTSMLELVDTWKSQGSSAG